MRKAVIQAGSVVNIIEIDPDNIPDWAKDLPDADAQAEIGGTFDGKTFVRVSAVKPDINARRAEAKLTKAQFIVRCKRVGILTQEEAISSAKGDMPQSFLSAIVAAGGPADEAQIVWASVSEIWRTDAYVQILAALPSIGPATTDALFGIA